jgi:hypothetical protein
VVLRPLKFFSIFIINNNFNLMVEQTDKPDLAPGKYDDDGFYIFEEGGFLDPHGVYFDKDGFDVNGGQYDD